MGAARLTEALLFLATYHHGKKRSLTKEHGMETIKVGNGNERRQHEQEHMSKEKIRTPERQLDDLDDKLSSRLRHDMRTQPAPVPSSGPPRTIRFIVFELSGKEHRDQNLVNGALDGDYADKTENGMRCIPKLQEPLKKRRTINK